jgi:hypothetical protein
MYCCLWDNVRCRCGGKLSCTQCSPQDGCDPLRYEPSISPPNVLGLQEGSDTITGLVNAAGYLTVGKSILACAATPPADVPTKPDRVCHE